MDNFKKHFLYILFIIGLLVLPFLFNTNYYSNVNIIFLLVILQTLWSFIILDKAKSQIYYWLIPILSILVSFNCQPFFENDYYRYFIDGLHALESYPVYSILPIDSLYKEFYSEVWSKAKFLEYGSIYPGLTTQFFSFLVFISKKNFSFFLVALKVASILFTILISFILYLHTKKKQCFFFICSPIILLEWHINLHFDFLLSLCILLFLISKNAYLKIAFINMGFHIKYIILFLIPSIFNSKWRKSKFSLLIFIVSLLITFNSYQSFDDFLFLIKNLKVFGLEWEMNPGIFKLTNFFLPTKMALALPLFFPIIFYILNEKYNILDKSSLYWCITIIFIITSPTVNLWYFTWALPLIFLFKDQIFLASLLHSPLFFSYMYYLDSDFNKWHNVEHLLICFLFILFLWTNIKKAKNI